ncbi:MAG TPA: ion transporter [Gaiellaceae bacterium]
MDAVARACGRAVDALWFQVAVVVAILANALLLGLETYDGIEDRYAGALNALNDAFLLLFTVEILIRILAYGRRPWAYFRSGWNVFDFVVVGLAYLPFVRESVTLLRLARALRVARLITVLPELRVVIGGLVRSVAPLMSVALLTFFLLYMYGMVGWLWFGDHDPENFGNIGRAMLTLFQLLTLEGWNEVLDTELEYSRWSWIYFVSFILVASFMVLNLVIAIVLNSVEEAREDERRRRRMVRAEAAGLEGQAGARGHPAVLEERLREVRDALEALEAELAREPEGRDEGRAGTASGARA